MNSQWDDREAAKFPGDLPQTAYASRLLGRERALVLHGGGNTSVKVQERNLFGQDEDILYVKGRGCNLETIDEKGFSPCRLTYLRRLIELDALSDLQMESEFAVSLARADAPAPSVETFLHALAPAKFVDHTHSDALLTVMSACNGRKRVAEIYGERLLIIPYAMPGFKLVRLCRDLFPKLVTERTVGIALMNHGLLTFGSTAHQAYERMIELATAAEDYLKRNRVWDVPRMERPSADTATPIDRTEVASLRRAVSDAAGVPLIVGVHADEDALAFACRHDVQDVTQQGPLTPDHVIRTKRIPLIGRDVLGYAESYRRYFEEYGSPGLTALDPAPRVILDNRLGLCSVGKTAKDAAITEEIYRHTMLAIARATALGGYHGVTAGEIFAVEYWDLEQRKLRHPGPPKPFEGEICLVTGAASGIGKACVASLLARGAAVVGLDLAPQVRELHRRDDYLGIQCDLTSQMQIENALDQGVSAFGGLDMLFLNAGIFPPSSPIASLDGETWRRVMNVNLDANFALMSLSHPLLKLAPRGGRVVLIGSKNVMAPGPGAAAYSASKAALQQLARVGALEWGGDGIRVNTLHPNAVFDTAIWTDEVLAARASSYGMSVAEYKKNNVLGVEVTSYDVAELACELCGNLFSKTTGAQIPVDGGNVRVI